MRVQPILREIKNGWAAVGNGWAVHAPTREDALLAYEQAERKHEEIDQKPFIFKAKACESGAQVLNTAIVEEVESARLNVQPEGDDLAVILED